MVKRALWRRHLLRFQRRRGSVACAGMLAFLVLLALAVPALPLAPPHRVDTDRAHHSPSASLEGAFWERAGPLQDAWIATLWPWDRLLVRARWALLGDRELPAMCGRDALGRCLLARMLWGARMSLAVGMCATLISLLIGVTVGAVAGACGGRIDQFLMRLVDMLYGVPFIFVVIFLIAMLRAHAERVGLESLQVLVFFGVIGLVYWLTMARVVRAQVVSLREQEFVAAARALGASTGRLIGRHFLPNLYSLIIVTLTLTIPRVLLFESFVSFLGLGVQAPDVSWGILMREAFDALNPIVIPWWQVVWPGLLLATTLGALNHIGDCLRDALDPRTGS